MPFKKVSLTKFNDIDKSAYFFLWWSLSDSNRSPLACKASALPDELRPHIESLSISVVHCCHGTIITNDTVVFYGLTEYIFLKLFPEYFICLMSKKVNSPSDSPSDSLSFFLALGIRFELVERNHAQRFSKPPV